MGPIWGGIAPPGGHMGPLGPYGADLPPSPPGQLRRSSQGRFFPARKRLFGILGPKNGQKKVEIEGVGPIWRDPRRNSAEFPARDVQNGWMATQLVTKRCDFGSLGVPGPASTPLGRRGRATSSIDPKLDLDLDISDLGFDQISTYKRGGWFRATYPP